MNNLPHHIFWDFDGTLFDTYPQITDSLIHALEDFHIEKQFDRAELLHRLKFSCTEAIRYCSNKAQVHEHSLAEAFQKYHQQTSLFIPYDGLRECLHTLCCLGCKHYLYTHRNKSGIQQLQQKGLWKYFTDGIIADMKFPLKPDPSALLWLCYEHHLNPDNCVMIGDRAIDLAAGKAAGMRGILFDPDAFYPDYNADWRVDNMQEIIQIYTKDHNKLMDSN